MNVFNKDTQTPQTVVAPVSDRILPGPASLVWTRIGELDALQGVNGWSADKTGADAKLIHGDRWEDITGTQTSTIGVDHVFHVQTNERIKIDGTQEFTQVGGATWTFMSTQDETHHGTTSITYNQTLSTTHLEPEDDTRPVHFEVENESYCFTGFDFALNGLAIEITVLSLALVLIALESKIVDVGLAGIKLEKNEAAGKLEFVKGELVTLKAMIGAKLKSAPTANASGTASPTL